MSPRPTHFLCLPLVNTASLPLLRASLAKFAQDEAVQRNVCSTGKTTRPRPPRPRKKASDSDTDAEKANEGKSTAEIPHEAYLPLKAIRPVETLHLTLGVMHLNDKARIDAASDFLKNMDVGSSLSRTKSAAESSSVESIPSSAVLNDTKTTSLKVYLKGLHPMQPSHKTRVLYAEPFDPSNRLLSFCNSIRDKFMQAGYVVDESRDLKLHATIVNTIYAPKVRQGGKSRNLEFDARDLIDQWKNEVWAEIDLSKLAICEMGAKEDVDGVVRYIEIAEIDF